MHEVIICEKPMSAAKIAQALSPKAKKNKYGKKVHYWTIDEGDQQISVVSAVGHLYGLSPKNPTEQVYFDLGWVPIHDSDKSKAYTREYIGAIKKVAKGADSFIHACDYDIEGTLIGYNALKYACGYTSLDKASRMKFSTLTKKDILEAYNNRIPIDMHQVDSGNARHILDFYFGANISKALMQAVSNSKRRYLKLSAGRVQTPCLSILSDREKEIREFIPEPYWILKALLNHEIVADHKEGKIFDDEKAQAIYEKCKGEDATVTKINISKSKTAPPIPFNLGGLQSEAYNVFGYSPKRTQSIAQKLYVGGYTSYPRTSSQKLPEALDYKNILSQLSNDSEYKKHIQTLPSVLKLKEGKKDDAAHPAIHPTGILPQKLSAEEQKIYDLIVFRFISVFSDSAEFESMNTKLDIAGEEFSFRRRRCIYEGWLAHYPFKNIDYEVFPDVKEGETLNVNDITKEEKETKPPARYNEATLVKELEKRELGTKATRADIITKLYDRKYVEGTKIEVTKLGENIIDILSKYCSNITSEELTREIELKLQGIDEDKSTKEEVILEGKKDVISILDDIYKNEKEIGSHLYDAFQESNIVGTCPDCGGKLIKRYSPKTRSTFVGCSNYPECYKAFSFPKGSYFLKKTCPNCGLPMISFGKGRKRQHACLDPNCGKENVKKSEPEVVGECPECGKPLLKRSGRYGEFVGCKGFPRCKFTCSIADLEKLED